MIGGGVGFLQGALGLGVDNMVSARLVGADGRARTVSADADPDLWWGLRGAGHDFGIVSSVTVRAHPELNGGLHYAALAIFPGEALEAVAAAIDTMWRGWDADGTPADVGLEMLFFRAPPAFADPTVVALSLWHAGGQDTFRERY